MPTYQYACTECGHEFETVQSFADASLTECPACTGKLRKVFNAVGIVFKGTGFYRTDSRAGEKTAAADAGSGKDGAGTKDGDASTPKDAGGTAKPAAAAASSSPGSSSAASSSTASSPASSSTAGSAA